jgi:CheY-like chemotaxis protein
MLTLNKYPKPTPQSYFPPKTDKKCFYQSPHILMIEDTPLVQYAQKQVLERIGCRVTVVDQGALGIAFAKINAVDAIIVDLELPDMLGTQVARVIRHADKLVPIIACSTRCIDLSIHTEIDHALLKPMLADAIFAVLSRLLGDRFFIPLH